MHVSQPSGICLLFASFLVIAFEHVRKTCCYLHAWWGELGGVTGQLAWGINVV
jgi:hypothetical protein